MRTSLLILLASLALPAGALEPSASELPAAALEAGPLKQGELAALEAELGALLAAHDEGRIDTNEAVADLFGATAASLAFVAAELSGGADGSAGALGAAQDVYSEFAVAAQERLVDALAVLDGVHANVRLQKRFTPFLAERPSAASDDAGWLGAVAWSGAEGAGVAAACYGARAGAVNGHVRLVGSGGREETLVLPFEASPRQNLFRLVTPRFDVAAPPADWRLELRYEAEARPVDIVVITAP